MSLICFYSARVHWIPCLNWLSTKTLAHISPNDKSMSAVVMNNWLQMSGTITTKPIPITLNSNIP